MYAVTARLSQDLHLLTAMTEIARMEMAAALNAKLKQRGVALAETSLTPINAMRHVEIVSSSEVMNVRMTISRTVMVVAPSAPLSPAGLA
jgi:hypothetical protein